MLILGCQIFSIFKTEQLILETGGRGWWSDALTAFARQVGDRANLRVVSLDWGFNEQLAFLTDKPDLREPFWDLLAGKDVKAPRSASCIYLVHPPEYTLFPFASSFLSDAQQAAPGSVDILAWRDRQGRIAFYSVRFREQ